jgi:hypothetical protein
MPIYWSLKSSKLSRATSSESRKLLILVEIRTHSVFMAIGIIVANNVPLHFIKLKIMSLTKLLS